MVARLEIVPPVIVVAAPPLGALPPFASYVMLRVFPVLTTTTPEPPAPPLAPNDESLSLEVPVAAPPPPLPVFAVPVVPTIFADESFFEPPLPPAP